MSKYNSYYRALSKRLQNEFIQRLFITNKFKKFIPVNFDEVTQEMKLIICSAIIQITFGLEQYILHRFDRIYVVPSQLYNFGEYKNLLGHVDYRNKTIVMSWPSVQEGFLIPDDAINVALHEIAHALEEENKFRMLGQKFFQEYEIKEWEKVAVKKLAVIKFKENKFLKSYGGKNMLELFAVSIEAFFEQPIEFKNELPDLYEKLVVLLNQDPTNQKGPIINDRSLYG